MADLTPEERERIYQEEKARIEAQQRPAQTAAARPISAQQATRESRSGKILAALLITVTVVCWVSVVLGNRHTQATEPDAPAAVSPRETISPEYTVQMNALMAHLRENGVEPVWPVQGNTDAIYVAPASKPNGWTSAEYRELAERVYSKFSEARQAAGVEDPATCFVHVMDTTGSQEMAADRIGKVE